MNQQYGHKEVLSRDPDGFYDSGKTTHMRYAQRNLTLCGVMQQHFDIRVDTQRPLLTIRLRIRAPGVSEKNGVNYMKTLHKKGFVMNKIGQ